MLFAHPHIDTRDCIAHVLVARAGGDPVTEASKIKVSALSIAVLSLIVVAAGGCGGPTDSKPSAVPPLPQPGPVAEFPALSRPGAIYNQEGDLYTYANVGLLVSRYVLYDDDGFELQFVNASGFFAYIGGYSIINGIVTLNFAESNSAGPWTATGAFAGDEFKVMYSPVARLAGFVDGGYRKSSGAP